MADQIGYSDREIIRAIFPFQNSQPVTGDENVIDQVLKPVDTGAAPAIANDCTSSDK
jgi:hypothetical protein